MASFSAVFDAAGSEECEVVSCEYTFNQSTDDKGRPSSVVQGAFIKVSLVSTDSVKLISWMLDPYKRADGKIVFKRGDQDSKMKELVFKEAYCVGYTETFDARRAESQASMVLSLIISANKIDVNGATLDNKWV
ncbi:type VI secretion system tube protein TssD [Hymenobacter sp. H14-R3]|uniref:type VI secretion system tube protein TssD n=1 Tax=Hymenobacter sp. H14-R3 TaxID=3046308 RepID=UPI0024B9FEA0|nr:type VI secretion system tube protein TssD [Hymenobacter sp. H14-R3]MDJ0364720.1 type VI secretion system tube protein TssD [Hymenobacter sp. H14-R3]